MCICSAFYFFPIPSFPPVIFEVICFVAEEDCILVQRCTTVGGVGSIDFSCSVDNSSCEAVIIILSIRDVEVAII